MEPIAARADGRFLVIAPRAPIEVRPGAFGWSPARFTADGPVEDAHDMEVSRRKVMRFLDEAVTRYGGDRGRVCAVGFSQGAALLLSASLTCPGQLTAAVIMSGRIVPQLVPSRVPAESLTGLRVLVVHGTRDRLVPIHHARATRAKLEGMSVRTDYREYDMAHEMGTASVTDVEEWLSAILDASTPC